MQWDLRKVNDMKINENKKIFKQKPPTRITQKNSKAICKIILYAQVCIWE